MHGKIDRAPLAALTAILFSFGCGGASYDAQACAENALRHGAAPALLADAEGQLRPWCATGDSASCSTLGVMYELGAGVRADRGRAEELYRHACSDGNARACQNLRALAPLPAARAPAEVARAGSEK